MERLLGLAINDTSLLPKVVSHHGEIFRLSRSLSDGGWGLGVHQHGEMLVKKRRISADIDSTQALLEANARHAVLHVGPRRQGPFELDHVQPYRYRNWLFASVGALNLNADFVASVSRRLRGFTAQGRWMSCPAECVMLIFMHAFHQVGELDRTRAHTRILRQALQRASADIVELGDLQDGAGLALVLHVRGYVYLLALGRPVAIRHLELRDPHRPALWRAERHARALAYQSDPEEGFGEALPGWSMVEIGPQAEVAFIDLS